jgi:hypothetical protein
MRLCDSDESFGVDLVGFSSIVANRPIVNVSMDIFLLISSSQISPAP